MNISNVYKSILDSMIDFKNINEAKGELIWLPFTSLQQIIHYTKLDVFNIEFKQILEIKNQIKYSNYILYEWILKFAWTLIQFSKENKLNLINCIVGGSNSTPKPIKETSSLNMHWMLNSYTKIVENKRPKRCFESKDSLFINDWSLWRYNIASIEENELIFNKNEENEINQILFFGYKDSLFYDKIINKWRDHDTINTSVKHHSNVNLEFCNASI